jgi:transposase InsO family protein
MGINEVLSAPRSPWQRAYIERVIGTIRRECVDHMIVFTRIVVSIPNVQVLHVNP